MRAPGSTRAEGSVSARQSPISPLASVVAPSETEIPYTMAEIRTILRREHRLRSGQEDDSQIRNQADSLVYSTEKTLADLADKGTAEERADIEAAVAALKEALRIDPKFPDANYILGDLAMDAEKYDDASELFKKIISDGFDGYTLRMKQAVIAHELKDNDAMFENLEAASKLDPSQSEPLAHIGIDIDDVTWAELVTFGIVATLAGTLLEGRAVRSATRTVPEAA